MKHSNTILIVEDERIPAEFLKAFLQENGYDVVGICTKGEQSIHVAQQLRPDVIFMDIILKDQMSGCEAAVQISSLIKTKIIFLTAYLNDEMIEYALESGAVNYLLKPYKEKQILAALKIALRQPNTKIDTNSPTTRELPCGYVYNFEKKRLFLKDKEVNISYKSLNLIHYLTLHIDTTISKEELSQYIYGETKDSSTIRTLVFRLRKQLNCNMIKNISGLGYKIASVLKS